MTEMQQAIVRSLPAEDKLRIELTVAGKQRFMSRPKTEPLERTLARIQKNAAPVPGKKTKQKSNKKEGEHSDSIMVALYEDRLEGKQVAGSIPNAEAWRPGCILQVGETNFSIILNPPTAEKLQVYGRPMVGYPLCPTLEVTFCDEADCRWQWFRSAEKTTDTAKPVSQRKSPSPRRRRPLPADRSDSISAEGTDGEVMQAAWQPLPGAQQRVYFPTAQDAGHRLRVECTPVREYSSIYGDAAAGKPAATETDSVSTGPALSAAAERHVHTSNPIAPPGVRVVTYNILADQYASSDYAQQHLFAYCPREFMVPEYRRPLIAQEILGYNADVVCLQEVDEKAFAVFFQPIMSYAGFDGRYTNKAGATAEGSAIFYRRSRFELVHKSDITMRDVFASLLAKEASSTLRHAQFLPLLHASPHLVQALQRVSTVAQITILQPRQPAPAEEGPLCVVNTHLFFHPKASHIRTLHTAAMLAEAHALMQETGSGLGRTPALLFCGDLNSDKNDGISGAVELLQKGRLPANHWDWEWGVDFRFVKDSDVDAGEGTGNHTATSASGNSGGNANGVNGRPAVMGVDVTLPFSLRSADGGRYEFTNYVRGYSGLLDYVFFQPERMRAREALPLPGAAELAGWIPSQRFPSDHLSLVFDLEWLPSQEEVSSSANAAEPCQISERAEPCSAAAAATGLNQRPRHLNSRSAEADAFGSTAALQPPTGTASRGDGNGMPTQQGAQAAEGSRRPRGAVLPADESGAAVAAEALRRGDVVAVPTDTLYGLAACANSEQGVGRLYAIKHRQAHVPLAICVADVAEVQRYGMCSHLPQGLLNNLLPGPVTVLLARRADAALSVSLNPGVATIGVRVPDSGFMRAACRQHGGAVALTSANISGAASSICIQDFQELWPECAAVFDGGIVGADRAGSTVVDLSVAGNFRIVREGAHPDHVRHTLTQKYNLVERK